MNSKLLKASIITSVIIATAVSSQATIFFDYASGTWAGNGTPDPKATAININGVSGTGNTLAGVGVDLDDPADGWDSLVADFTVNLIPADPSQPHSARFKVFTQTSLLTPFVITQTTNVLSAEVVIDFSEPVSIRDGDYFSTGAGTVTNEDDNATITYTLGNIIEISADQTTATSGVVDATDAYAFDGTVLPQNFVIGTIPAGGTTISWDKDVNLATGATNGLSGLDIDGNGALDDSQLMWYTQISQKYTPTEYDPNITYDPATNPSPELNFASQYRSTFDAVQHSITLRDLAATAIVPEPAVSGMLGLSLLSLVMRRRR